jgi:hypothetical protein
MKKYCWLVLLVFMVITIDLPAQTTQSGYYRYRLKEQVMADYHNLLDTAKGRNYRTIEKYFSGRLFVYSINDSTTFIHWNPDTIQEQSKPVQTLGSGWKAVFSSGAHEKWGATLYSDTIIPPYWLNQLKMIAGSVRFNLPNSLQMAEPSPDGVYNVAYNIQEKNLNSIRMIKSKEAIYLPGISFYRICIDSFRAVYHYNHPSGLLQNGFSYEEKRQKIGQRILAKISSETKVEPCEPFFKELPETTGWELVYTRPYPVFFRLGYSARAVKQAMNYEPVYTLNALFHPESGNKADTGLQLTGRIRSSILRGSLSYKTITDILDTVSLASKAYAILEDALVEAGTEEAQYLLANLADRKGEPDFFYKRLIIKAGITAPLHSKKLLSKLMAFRSDTSNPVFASVAGLALANNASLMHDEGMQKERVQILEFLRMCFITSAREQSDSLQWLLEAGNAGDEQVVTMAGYCLTTRASELYQEALHSIRFIHGAKADSLLAIQLISNGKANISLLTDVCKLRYPSIIIRTAFYQFLQVNRGISLSVVKPFIDYLVSWQDEIKTLSAELLQAVSGMQDIEKYCDILRATK